MLCGQVLLCFVLMCWIAVQLQRLVYTLKQYVPVKPGDETANFHANHMCSPGITAVHFGQVIHTASAACCPAQPL
jgi:hypothetical protein